MHVTTLVLISLLLATPVHARGQEPPPGPPTSADSAAVRFQTGLRSGSWQALALLVHPEALTRFRAQVERFIEPDTTGYVLDALLPGTGRDEVATLDDAEVFVRALRNLMDDMPGVRHALFARRVRILGSVPEPPDLAHVTYRNTDALDGAVPELRVMTLKRQGDRWLVLESPELELVREALRGVIRGRPRPPGGGLHRGPSTTAEESP